MVTFYLLLRTIFWSCTVLSNLNFNVVRSEFVVSMCQIYSCLYKTLIKSLFSFPSSKTWLLLAASIRLFSHTYRTTQIDVFENSFLTQVYVYWLKYSYSSGKLFYFMFYNFFYFIPNFSINFWFISWNKYLRNLTLLGFVLFKWIHLYLYLMLFPTILNNSTIEVTLFLLNFLFMFLKILTEVQNLRWNIFFKIIIILKFLKYVAQWMKNTLYRKLWSYIFLIIL